LARAVAWPRADTELFAGVVHHFDADLTEALVGVGRGIVGDGVRVAQVFADGLERLHLLLPGTGPVGFASGARGQPAEDTAGDGVLVDLIGRDHINRDPL